MDVIHQQIGIVEDKRVPDGHTAFVADGELLCLPNKVIDGWTPAQVRWVTQNRVPNSYPEIERRAKVAAQMWAAKNNGFGRHWVTKHARPVTKFQFWLRTELTRLGLI